MLDIVATNHDRDVTLRAYDGRMCKCDGGFILDTSVVDDVAICIMHCAHCGKFLAMGVDGAGISAGGA